MNTLNNLVCFGAMCTVHSPHIWLRGNSVPGGPAPLQTKDFPKIGESDCKTSDWCGALNSRQGITTASLGHSAECMKHFKKHRNKKSCQLKFTENIFQRQQLHLTAVCLAAQLPWEHWGGIKRGIKPFIPKDIYLHPSHWGIQEHKCRGQVDTSWLVEQAVLLCCKPARSEGVLALVTLRGWNLKFHPVFWGEPESSYCFMAEQLQGTPGKFAGRRKSWFLFKMELKVFWLNRCSCSGCFVLVESIVSL